MLNPDSVTPTKWKGPDGKVWERTGEKRYPRPGEYIWWDTSQPEPYIYLGVSIGDFATPIWKVSEDQNWEPEPPRPVTPPTIEELLARAQFTEEPAELNRFLVLGVLYQVRELARIVEILETRDSFGSP